MTGELPFPIVSKKRKGVLTRAVSLFPALHANPSRKWRVCVYCREKGPSPRRGLGSEAACTESEEVAVLFWVFAIELQLDDSTLQAYSYGMGSVVRAQFGENTLDVAFDRVQRDLQMIGD